MRHPSLLAPENTLLLIIDVQEKFREHIDNFADTVKSIAILSEGMQLLKVPVFVTEQYPKGLGRLSF